MSFSDGITVPTTQTISDTAKSSLSDLSSSLTSSVQSCSLSNFQGKLPGLGFDQSQIDSIMGAIPSNFLSGASGNLATKLQEAMAKSKTLNLPQIAGATNAAKASDVKKAQIVQLKSYTPQEAKSSPSLSESQFSGKAAKGGKQVNQPQANHSMEEDYPESYGAVDDSKLWYKINKKQKTFEFVHPSGTQFKIDKFGNVTLDISGSMKFIVAGDLSMEVRGNEDRIVRKNFNEVILGASTRKVSKTNLDQVAGKWTMLGNPITEN